jgi:hypothetical protein
MSDRYWSLARRMGAAVVLALGLAATAACAADDSDVYPTYGVHNPPEHSNCASPDCVYKRGPGEPTDPFYPEYWSSNWNMYRVFNGYVDHPPPYDGKPPAPLKEGQDYETSYGATYYDATWRGPTGEGAMMEHYVKRCLPIFPGANNYTCSFISLGDMAYFLTYGEDRPKGMPPCCVFSTLNHPPRQDFIKHLPYSKGDSERLGNKVQGYSFWVDPSSDGPPIQVGVSPDRTADGDIMFGYAFYSTPAPDRVNKSVAPYRHPQSFYFSGVSGVPPFAPIVSQNYTDFAMVRPDPAKTWDLIGQMCVGDVPRCELFNRDISADASSKPLGAAKADQPVTWGDIEPK